MVDYSKAKIYKVLNDLDDDVYIGATCQSLNMRMVGHRKARTSTKHKNYKLYKKMNEIGVEHFYIELIKETPCENKEQLRAIEGDYIRKYGTLNSKIENRTIKEWTEQYKETKKEQNRIKYEKDREKILEQQKAYQKVKVVCNFCHMEMLRGSLNKHIKRKHS
eukprot:Skav231951  [mRNA]  locus=scaffold6053:118:606:+ [translate_table: standard]